MNRPDVLALFAGQHWVAAWHQLQQLGVTRSAVSRARRRGLVTSPLRGVVAVAGVELSFAGSGAGRPAGGWVGGVRQRADRRRRCTGCATCPGSGSR